MVDHDIEVVVERLESARENPAIMLPGRHGAGRGSVMISTRNSKGNRMVITSR
jgi:hypothetical protein